MEAHLAAIPDTRSRFAPNTQSFASWLRWALLAFVATLPFELSNGVPIVGFTLTNVELLTLILIGLWSGLLVSERRLPYVPRWLALCVAAFLATMLVSAVVAGEWRGAALKFTARQIQGVLIGLCLADQLRRQGWPLMRQCAIALIAGATLSAVLGLLEMAEWPPVLAMLMVFKEQPTLAGGLLRLSATFAYANIAAMYYEAIVPFALLGAGLAVSRGMNHGDPGQRTKNEHALVRLSSFGLRGSSSYAGIPFAVGACILYVAALLTYSRAALLTATALVLVTIIGSVSLQRQNADSERVHVSRIIGVGVSLLVILLTLLVVSPSFQVRIAEPDVDRWYRATYQVSPVSTLSPNEVVQVPVTVGNTGRVPWRSTTIRPVALSYHWLDAQSRLVVRFNGRRTLLPAPLDPGQSVGLNAVVQAPSQPGDYLLVWDMVVEQSGWFSERGNPVSELAVQVVGQPAVSQPAPAPEPAGLPRQIILRPPPPARSVLWAAAVEIWRAHPLLGIGPDVFRHVYGPVIGVHEWDDRIHTNNLYLEILVGTGMLGLGAFLALVISVSVAGVRLVVRTTGHTRWVVLACLLSLSSFLIHGTLDMFLEYSATYLLPWGLVGTLGALMAEKRALDKQT